MNDTTNSVAIGRERRSTPAPSRSRPGGVRLQEPVPPMAAAMCHEYFENALKVLFGLE